MRAVVALLGLLLAALPAAAQKDGNSHDAAGRLTGRGTGPAPAR